MGRKVVDIGFLTKALVADNEQLGFGNDNVHPDNLVGGAQTNPLNSSGYLAHRPDIALVKRLAMPLAVEITTSF